MTEQWRRMVLVTGSRDWEDRGYVRWVLDEIGFMTGFGRLTVIHGACADRRGRFRGADRWADEWARQNWDLGVRLRTFPADWNQYGNGAGPRRNAQMVKLLRPVQAEEKLPDIVVAFINPCTQPRCTVDGPHGSHGATDCADRAHKAGIAVRRYP